MDFDSFDFGGDYGFGDTVSSGFDSVGGSGFDFAGAGDFGSSVFDSVGSGVAGGFDWGSLGTSLATNLGTAAIQFGVNYGTAALLGGTKAGQQQLIGGVLSRPAVNQPGAGFAGSAANPQPIVINQPAPAGGLDSKTMLMLAGGFGLLAVLLVSRK